MSLTPTPTSTMTSMSTSNLWMTWISQRANQAPSTRASPSMKTLENTPFYWKYRLEAITKPRTFKRF